MNTFQSTIQALGSPLWVRRLEGWRGSEIRVARWRHGDARVAVPRSDAIRVVLNLAGGPRVRHIEQRQLTDVQSDPGDISLMLPGVASETSIAGHADVLQLFISPSALDLETLQIPSPSSGMAGYNQLRRAVLLWLVASSNDVERHAYVCSLLRDSVAALLRLPPQAEHARTQELGPLPVRRAAGIISHAVAYSETATLAKVAATTGWSVPHLIRTFRKARGITPHQLLISRRLEHAMELLLQPHLTVAEIGDAAGFSSPAHFGASFRQHLGITPGAYRHVLEAS